MQQRWASENRNGNGTTLYKRIVEEIRFKMESGELTAGDRLPSIKELCRKYNVSHITVRAALKELAQEELVESRPRSGFFVTSPATGASEDTDSPNLSGERAIAFLVPAMEDRFYAQIVAGAENALRDEGYRTVVVNSNENIELEARQLQQLAHQVAGLLVVPATPRGNYAAYLGLLERDVPFVFVDRKVEKLAVPLIASDNIKGGYIATRHLLQTGRERIYVVSERPATSLQERVAGYRKALQEEKIDYIPAMIRQTKLRNEIAGYTLMRELLEEYSAPNEMGIVALTESVARGCYAAIKEAGLRIPEDIAIVGYDDISCAFFDPPMTTVRQDMFKMGTTAARILLEMIRSRNTNCPSGALLEPELIVRRSADERNDFSLADYLHYSEDNPSVNSPRALPASLELNETSVII